MPRSSPPPDSALDRAPVVARLRAAGCVFAEEEADLLVAEATSPDHLEAMLVRREAGEPLELIVGWAELAGVRVRTAPGVFVPRQRSVRLVDLAVEALASGPVGRVEADIVVDLGCGTGALAAAVSARVPAAEVWAVDVDSAAVACARTNLPPERVFEGDLFGPLPDRLRGQVAVILANAPYVPTDAIALMPPEAREHEHRVALDGGGDGLDVQRRLIPAAPDWLRPGGVLLVETATEQAATAVALMRAAGLEPQLHQDDEIPGVTVAGRRGPDAEAGSSTPHRWTTPQRWNGAPPRL